MNKKHPVSQVGLIFGKFYPLHRGHIYMIERACAEVGALHVILGCETQRDISLFEQSHLPRMPSPQDRLRWLRKTFHHQPNIHIHRLDEDGILPYPNGWADWSERVKHLLHRLKIHPTVIFTSERQDHQWHCHHFRCPVRVVDEKRDYIAISATQIRENPYKYWNDIACVAQPFFVKRICIPDHPNLPGAATRFAAIFNTICVLNGDNYFNRLEKASQHAYRYVFTNVLLTLTEDEIGKAFNRKRPLLLPTDWVINTHKWPSQLKSETVFRRILESLHHLSVSEVTHHLRT